MRILHLITRMDGGGSAVSTLVSAIWQLEQGHEVCLGFGPVEASGMSGTERVQLEGRMNKFRGLGGKVVVLPSLERQPGVRDFRAYGEIRRLVSEGFDVVHTHTSKAGALGRLAAWKRAKVVVHTPHGHIFHGYFGKGMTALFTGIERRLASRAHALVALTRAEKADHLRVRIGRPDQWRVIPSGVDVEGIKKRVAAWRESHPDSKMWDAVSVGRLVPVKGMDRLIRAWQKVCAQRPEAGLVIVGDGAERENLEDLCRKLGIEKNIRFAGWSDPVPYLAASRRFVLLSHNEGMGRAVVEAMAAGLPCVVSAVCGLQELVTEACGAVVDADDADAVAAVLLHEQSSNTGQTCRKRAMDYSVEVMGECLQGLYEELLSHAV